MNHRSRHVSTHVHRAGPRRSRVIPCKRRIVVWLCLLAPSVCMAQGQTADPRVEDPATIMEAGAPSLEPEAGGARIACDEDPAAVEGHGDCDESGFSDEPGMNDLPGDLGLQHMPVIEEVGEETGEGVNGETEVDIPATGESPPGRVDPGAILAVPLRMLNDVVIGGESKTLKWSAGHSFGGRSLDVPVMVAHGLKKGKVLCLTGAVHGDELNGIEIVSRTMAGLDPGDMSGTVIGVPVVNLLGFMRGTRYLPDRRDLNRYFPGNPRGSAASRIAYLFFERVVRHCDYLVDIHTGSLNRTNLPQLRADLSDPGVYAFAQSFGATAVLHHRGAKGTLRKVASDTGIPAVTCELGEPHTLQAEHVEFGVRAIETLMDKLGMIDRFRLWLEPQPVFYASRWVRADQGGILITSTQLGARVREGDVLGTVSNPLTDEAWSVRAPYRGRVLGMALSQFVLPGFAAFHIGIETREPAMLASEIEENISDDTEQLPEHADGQPDEPPDAPEEVREAGDYD